MIELTVRRLPWKARAMTIWPFILYTPLVRYDKCIQVHEHYHWVDQLRWLVLPWFLVYLVDFLWHSLIIRKWKASDLWLEKEAYRRQWECEGK